jgi:hypothetical protein
MKLKAGETFYIVWDKDGLSTPILVKELEGDWHKLVSKIEIDDPPCDCRDITYCLDNIYCAGCGAPI